MLHCVYLTHTRRLAGLYIRDKAVPRALWWHVPVVFSAYFRCHVMGLTACQACNTILTIDLMDVLGTYTAPSSCFVLHTKLSLFRTHPVFPTCTGAQQILHFLRLISIGKMRYLITKSAQICFTLVKPHHKSNTIC